MEHDGRPRVDCHDRILEAAGEIEQIANHIVQFSLRGLKHLGKDGETGAKGSEG